MASVEIRKAPDNDPHFPGRWVVMLPAQGDLDIWPTAYADKEAAADAGIRYLERWKRGEAR